MLLDICIVFPQWHITSNTSFVISFFVIVGLGVAYEWLREFQRRVDLNIARSLRVGRSDEGAVSGANTSGVPNEEDSLLTESPKGRRMYASSAFSSDCTAIANHCMLQCGSSTACSAIPSSTV